MPRSPAPAGPAATTHPDGADLARLRSALRAWYGALGRPLRFRSTRDPWAVLLCEVMAQQTQVERADVAWVRFVAAYPTPAALARATTAEVLRAWAGLGYNRRAVALQRTASAIVRDHAGQVPRDLHELMALPGVGPYTARAVAAIAFGQEQAAVDTNVRRIVLRLGGAGLDGRPPSQPPARVQATADRLLDRSDPARWTHALMDLGATVCRARLPRCGECPLAPWCRSAGRVAPKGAGSPATEGRSGQGRPSDGRPGRRTPPFESTTRWLRGRIVEHLRSAADGTWLRLEQGIGVHPAEAVASALAALERDGLVERRPDGAVRLPST